MIFKEVTIMSQQAIEQFLEALARDEVLLAKLATADSASSVVKIAAEFGYELSESDLAVVAEQMRLALSSEELSDDELEAISGGTFLTVTTVGGVSNLN